MTRVYNYTAKYVSVIQKIKHPLRVGWRNFSLLSQKDSLSPHQKQHCVPYYLSIVLILSLKYAFGIISMFFTLVRCSIVLLMLLLTYCIHVSYRMFKFIAFLNVFSCPTRNVPYGKSCLVLYRSTSLQSLSFLKNIKTFL